MPIVWIVHTKPPINIKCVLRIHSKCSCIRHVIYTYVLYLYTHSWCVNDGGGLWIFFNVFIFLKSSRGLVCVNRSLGPTVLWINVFDLLFLYTFIHGNPKALERLTAVNNQQQSITYIICTYHHAMMIIGVHTYITVAERCVLQMDRLNSFAGVIFGRKQCVSRRIWQTIGPEGDLYCPLNGFLRHSAVIVAIWSRTTGDVAKEGNGLNLHVVRWYTDENEFLLSSRPASSFAAEGDEGFSLQDNERVEGSGAENRRICKSGRTKHEPLLCRGYDELRGRPQDRYWPFVTIKKRYETFFDIVIHLYLCAQFICPENSRTSWKW